MLTLGHGVDAVLLASPLARGEIYVRTAHALARHLRVHLVEMPGSGAGTRLKAPWSIMDYADWSAEAIARSGIEGSVVIGHSYSGMVAVAVAARQPNLPRRTNCEQTPE